MFLAALSFSRFLSLAVRRSSSCLAFLGALRKRRGDMPSPSSPQVRQIGSALPDRGASSPSRPSHVRPLSSRRSGGGVYGAGRRRRRGGGRRSKNRTCGKVSRTVRAHGCLGTDRCCVAHTRTLGTRSCTAERSACMHACGALTSSNETEDATQHVCSRVAAGGAALNHKIGRGDSALPQRRQRGLPRALRIRGSRQAALLSSATFLCFSGFVACGVASAPDAAATSGVVARLRHPNQDVRRSCSMVAAQGQCLP